MLATRHPPIHIHTKRRIAGTLGADTIQRQACSRQEYQAESDVLVLLFMPRVQFLGMNGRPHCKVAASCGCVCCSGVIRIGNETTALGISEVEATLW